MQVWDRQHGAVHALSIAPTSAVSSDQTGVGVDMGQGSMIGHATIHDRDITSDYTVDVQQSDDDVDADYATTDAFIIDAANGDRGTLGVANRSHTLQFARTKRWARVKIVVGSNTNVRFSASLESQLASGGGGSSISPAG